MQKLKLVHDGVDNANNFLKCLSSIPPHSTGKDIAKMLGIAEWRVHEYRAKLLAANRIGKINNGNEYAVLDNCPITKEEYSMKAPKSADAPHRKYNKAIVKSQSSPSPVAMLNSPLKLTPILESNHSDISISGSPAAIVNLFRLMGGL